MIFREKFPKQMEMNELELTLKELWTAHPELNLNYPHPQEYYTQVFAHVAHMTNHPFPDKILNARLDEPSLFPGGL